MGFLDEFIEGAEYPEAFPFAQTPAAVLGTPTAEANGDGIALIVPGGIYIGFMGQGVWHPDDR